MFEEFDRTQWTLNQEKTEKAEKMDCLESNSTNFVPDLVCVKSQALIRYISENLLAADLKWSLFCAACNSYRFDSVLKPFPPFFLIEDNVKQIENLREVITLCPSMSNVVGRLKDNSLPPVLMDLLYWVLIQAHEPKFMYIPKEKHQEIISLVSSEAPPSMPDFLFSVSYSKKNEQKFALNALNYSKKFAFHGSRLDNFYSITNYGLQVCFNKVSACGLGIYLSKQMLVSLLYSPRGFTWDSSYFGSHISIIALCEVIDHPDLRSELDSRRNTLDSFSNNISSKGKYIIVGNSDLVCVKYLLIYTSDDFESTSLTNSPTLLGWMIRHKMIVFALAYIILLLGIGSSNTSFFYKFYKRVLKRFYD